MAPDCEQANGHAIDSDLASMGRAIDRLESKAPTTQSAHDPNRPRPKPPTTQTAHDPKRPRPKAPKTQSDHDPKRPRPKPPTTQSAHDPKRPRPKLRNCHPYPGGMVGDFPLFNVQDITHSAGGKVR
ncbi:hypothetical protein BV898_17696 [Hypsibius exemplaris]|uniref:Uncharacterized protein n=1 Tax=Hypsibius exemplaris TaxID=2072580 RepID=A0A9X6NFK1_HYPEX|nr:hypothetical protein BV898_17696 [Hypsibius exemplaris]